MPYVLKELCRSLRRSLEFAVGVYVHHPLISRTKFELEDRKGLTGSKLMYIINVTLVRRICSGGTHVPFLTPRRQAPYPARPRHLESPPAGGGPRPIPGERLLRSRDLLQVKYEMLRQVRVENQAVSHVAEAFGFSRPSFYLAQAGFAARGLAGLIPQKRGPRHAPSSRPR